MAKRDLGSQIVAQELDIQKLVQSSALVGGIYTMGYDECLLITNDLWKRQAGGIPQHCFLLATAMVPGGAPEPDDEEIILLRVIGPAPLPAEAELVQVREQAMREMVVNRGAEVAASSPAVLDVLTRNEIQFSGIRAKILGTFYESAPGGKPLLAFGSDVETFYSASRYKVFKPFGESLKTIASYPECTESEHLKKLAGGPEPRRVRIGTVRYSSASRRRTSLAGAQNSTAVPVSINVEDFIALKTAVFGMTRLGKSNTMKTIATAISQFASETNQSIGQLLFDPAGEYANINVQDKTALAQIGSEFVSIFRFGASGNEEGVRPLSTNFYADETISVAWAIITAYLTPRNQANYIQSFLAADVIGPDNEADDQSAFRRARRRRAALFAIFAKADFQAPANFRYSFGVNAPLLAQINQALPNGAQQFVTNRGGYLNASATDLVVFFESLQRLRTQGANLGDWIDAQLAAILEIFAGSVGSGFRLLEPLRTYHAPNRNEDYAAEILRELVAGKIVIVDLSVGSDTVKQFCSERIVNHIVSDAARRFSSGEHAHQIQIYIEEAHQLFNRDKMSVPEERDPYVRLAKEAAKYRIGLIYATQEVSSVDPLILSNTSNWIVTHLNNRNEIKELSKYYDFENFAELTLKAEDVGFARIKTRSGRYIIPIQIDKFEDARVQAARNAALAARNR